MEISWQSLTPQAALAELQSSPGGLGSEEAAARLQRYGLNRLPQAAPVSALTILWSQLTNLVTVLLLAAAAVSLLLGEVLESSAIFGVLALNIALGFAVELRARRVMEALTQLEVPRALILRSAASASCPRTRSCR
jgi:magnesium-transporting ATPase (P-type)